MLNIYPIGYISRVKWQIYTLKGIENNKSLKIVPYRVYKLDLCNILYPIGCIIGSIFFDLDVNWMEKLREYDGAAIMKDSFNGQPYAQRDKNIV